MKPLSSFKALHLNLNKALLMKRALHVLLFLSVTLLTATSCEESSSSNYNNLDSELFGEWRQDTSNDLRDVLTFDVQGRCAYFQLNVSTGEITDLYQPMEWYTINNYLHQVTQTAGVFVSEYSVTDSVLTLDSGTPVSFIKQ
jgi:hypothetical protein